MIVYLDSSVILRKLLGEPGDLHEWDRIETAYASRLMTIEVARVIDRLRLSCRIDDEGVAQLTTEMRRLVRSIDIVSLTEAILQRAAAPMPTLVGALDALHLATALQVATKNPALVFATHDVQLGRAARASGLGVIGV